jgi:outer membrane protein TolC
MSTARRSVEAAEQTLQLTQQRKEFAVGAVLENIQSEQELTRARFDYITAVAEYNKAQFSLLKALGRAGLERATDDNLYRPTRP